MVILLRRIPLLYVVHKPSRSAAGNGNLMTGRGYCTLCCTESKYQIQPFYVKKHWIEKNHTPINAECFTRTNTMPMQFKEYLSNERLSNERKRFTS
jgi:hypothetical protein